MFDINMIESGTIAKTRGGIPMLLFWRYGKLYCVESNSCFPFDRMYEPDGMIYPKRMDRLDIVALYHPDGTVEFKNVLAYSKPYWQRDNTDWKQVKQGTPVLVSNDGNTWQKGHFCKVKYGKIRVYNYGRTPFTSCPAETTGFKYGKLAN